MERMNQFVLWSTTKPTGQWVLILLQVVSGAAGVIYSTTQNYNALWAVTFFGSISLVIIWAFVILLFNRTHGIIILILNHDTGVLYDKKTNFRNVSLRRDTIQELISSILSESQNRCNELLECSYSIGKQFAEQYDAHILNGKRSMNGESVLSEMMAYDSSSGMGKFEVLKYSDIPQKYIEICITNPFMNPTSSEDGRCNFYLGYLKGIVEEVFGQSFNVSVKDVSSDSPKSLIVQVTLST